MKINEETYYMDWFFTISSNGDGVGEDCTNDMDECLDVQEDDRARRYMNDRTWLMHDIASFDIDDLVALFMQAEFLR